jgi:DNA-binding NtrC family response regulator
MLGLPGPTLELFKNYRWPGNVRELRNAVERAVLLCAGPSILSEHLPPAIVHSPPPPVRVVATPPSTFVPEAPAGVPKGGSLQDTLAAVEKERIIAALEQCGYNQSRAAKMLGISRNTLIARLNAYNLSRPRMPKDVG